MKKIFVALLICSLSCVFLCACGKPQASPVEDFSYEFDEGTVKITGYIGTARNIVIPDTIDERPVTMIGKNAFKEYDLVSIDLPETLETIEDDAFQKCTSLKSIKIPSKVKIINSGVFLQCTELEMVSLSENTTKIKLSAFKGCSSLTSIVIPNSVETIGNWSFSGCSSLENIVIPDSVESIGENCFRSCKNLKSVTMSNKLLEREKLDFIHHPSVIANQEAFNNYGIFSDCPDVKINNISISEFDTEK